jgi:hypothetical protein
VRGAALVCLVSFGLARRRRSAPVGGPVLGLLTPALLLFLAFQVQTAVTAIPLPRLLAPTILLLPSALAVATLAPWRPAPVSST